MINEVNTALDASIYIMKAVKDSNREALFEIILEFFTDNWSLLIY